MIPTLHEQGISFYCETILISVIHTFIDPIFSRKFPPNKHFFPVYLLPVHIPPLFAYVELIIPNELDNLHPS
jgi:hypothetical protein